MTEEVAIFVAPFEGAHDVGGFFDHGSETIKRQITRNGTVAYGKQGHQGYDFSLRVGTPVLAMASGRVLVAGDQGPTRCESGKVDRSVLVRIAHDPAPNGERYETLLMHLSDVTVAAGDRVTAGQLVGHSGNTGCSSGPHLHVSVFRVRALGRDDAIDPYGWGGPGNDPHPEHNVWLWKEGAAPPLRRHSRRAGDRKGFGPARMRGTDLLDPIGGEWLDLGNPTPTPRAVGGMVLTNDGGDRFVLPERTIQPGKLLRIWTAAPSERGLSWGLDHEAWNDLGDCARLLSADGAVIGALRFGPKSVVCPVPDTDGAEIDETEATDGPALAIPVSSPGPAGP